MYLHKMNGMLNNINDIQEYKYRLYNIKTHQLLEIKADM